jgi:DNA-binding transcriptional ArsR family regulator
MNIASQTARSLAALGHEARLAVYRLLVKAGPDGMPVGDIGAHMGLPASTLAHHLRALVDAGLVIQEKHGRTVFNRADYDQMRRTVEFLTSECCSGIALKHTDSAA